MINKTEEFVFNVCRSTFLSLWSYPNPLAKDNKELCDILVVCEPDVVIFSVKEIRTIESGDVRTDWERWNRRAVEESAKQIYGAERWLRNAPNVIKKDGTYGLKLPPDKNQKIHRIAVALGGESKVPILSGDFGKGFVHVFDETSFSIILKELDTISDFISYLSAKEQFYTAGKETPFLAGEENLLALYLYSGKKFPSNYDVVFVGNELWNSFKKKHEYLKKKEEDKISYVWDEVIEDIAKDVVKGKLEFSSSPEGAEIVLRAMAREDRFTRRILGKSFAEFILLSSQNKVKSRMLPSPSGIVYVLLALPHTIDRKYRKAELGIRCFIARGMNSGCNTVIGIATEQSKPGVGHSFDLYNIYLPIWTTKHQEEMESLQKDTGFFLKSLRTKVHEDEYPQE